MVAQVWRRITTECGLHSQHCLSTCQTLVECPESADWYSRMPLLCLPHFVIWGINKESLSLFAIILTILHSLRRVRRSVPVPSSCAYRERCFLVGSLFIANALGPQKESLLSININTKKNSLFSVGCWENYRPTGSSLSPQTSSLCRKLQALFPIRPCAGIHMLKQSGYISHQLLSTARL